MAWPIVIVSLIVLWVASLFKILLESYPHSKATFLNNGGGALHKRNVLLVIAHPDDESMFFTPTINYLTSRGHNLHILCMSTGNADGKGNIRKDELYQASAILKIPTIQVKILEHQHLQDGFGKIWSSSLVANIIEEEIHNRAIDSIISFDNYGVSGHCNHCDVSKGVRKLLCDTSKSNFEAWELVTTNILRKYSGPIDIWLSVLNIKRNPNGEMHCLLNEQPRRSYVAMAQHMSQWVWYASLCFYMEKQKAEVPEAFCLVFQLYLCEHTSEDQVGIHEFMGKAEVIITCTICLACYPLLRTFCISRMCTTFFVAFNQLFSMSVYVLVHI